MGIGTSCAVRFEVFFARDNFLKKGATKLCTLTGGSVVAAVVVVKGTDGPDLPSGSESLPLDATTGPSSFVAPDTAMVCTYVPLTKSAKDGRVFCRV